MNTKMTAMNWDSIQAEEASEIVALTNEEAEAVSGGPKGDHRGQREAARNRRARRTMRGDGIGLRF